MKKVCLFDNSGVKFSIVYPKDINFKVIEAIEMLRALLIEKSCTESVDVKESDIGAYSSEEYEILVGDVGFPELQRVMSSIQYGEWKVCFVGNKLVVAAFSREALMIALDEIAKCVSGSVINGAVELDMDWCISGEENTLVDLLPRFDEKIFPITVDEGNDTFLAIFSEVDKDRYISYLNSIEQEGYKLYTSNTICDNIFYTYENDRYLIHAGYYAYKQQVRVSIEKKGGLAPRECDNKYSPIEGTQTLFAQIGNTEEHGIGMGYCFRLTDGSFIIIDGGCMGTAHRLYKYLLRSSPYEKIKIAAWIITHNDGDHRFCFSEFVANYNDKVEIERLIVNLPSVAYCQEAKGDGSVDIFDSAKNVSGIKIIKAHTGQKFYIRNAVIEMLYSMDSYYPRRLAIFNNSSLAFTVEIEGHRILFLGDVSNVGAKIIGEMYGDYVKSDILQISHHGKRNGHGVNMPCMVELCSLIKAKILMWPTSIKSFNDDSRGDQYDTRLFEWNKKAMEYAEENYIASDYVTVLPLPYEKGSAYTICDDQL